MTGRQKKHFIGIVGIAALAFFLFQYQNCGHSSGGGGSGGGSGGISVGPSGLSYSVTMTPSTLNPPVGSSDSLNVAVTVSGSQSLQINTGYYDSSGQKVQSCTNALSSGNSLSFSCSVGPFNTNGVVSLYVDILDATTQTVELACNGYSTSGCTGIFGISVGTTGGGGGGTPVVAINCGSGGGYTSTASGITWSADQYYHGGNANNNSGKPAVTNAPNGDSQVYQSNRDGNFTYVIPVSNGPHTIVLKFAEYYWNSAGQRVFNIYINGSELLQDFDIFQAAGGRYLAIDQTFSNVVVTNGSVSIMAQTVHDNAQINGILIY